MTPGNLIRLIVLVAALVCLFCAAVNVLEWGLGSLKVHTGWCGVFLLAICGGLGWYWNGR